MLWIALASVVVVVLLSAAISYHGERRAYRRQRLQILNRELEAARTHRRRLDDIATARDRTANELARIASEPPDESMSIGQLFQHFFGAEGYR
jgi:hypothetical protein